jgi:single-strand DNA-binding protein
MSSLNLCVLIGRITKSPELVYSPSGVAICKFTLAVNREFKSDETDFIPIVCFKKTAENVANYLDKGSMVCVKGSIQVRTYETKDGQRRWVTEVIAENVRFLDKKEKPGLEQIGEEVPFNEDDVPF